MQHLMAKFSCHAFYARDTRKMQFKSRKLTLAIPPFSILSRLQVSDFGYKKTRQNTERIRYFYANLHINAVVHPLPPSSCNQHICALPAAASSCGSSRDEIDLLWWCGGQMQLARRTASPAKNFDKLTLLEPSLSRLLLHQCSSVDLF